MRKARRERERRMREWGSMGGIATPTLAPDLPFVYSPRAPHTRASHAPPTPKNGEETASVQHLILKWKILEFKMK